MSEFGKYVVLEGGDGVGKSTQAEILQGNLDNIGIESKIIEEPGGTLFADALRPIVKNGDLHAEPEANVMAFTAARIEADRKIIVPTIEDGKWVIATRNWVSTLAYQGRGQGVNLDDIWEITRLFASPTYIKPDYLCVLGLSDIIERQKRLAERGQPDTPDAFESQDEQFQQRVEDGYLEVAEKWKLPLIDASATREQVSREVWRHIEPLTEAA